MIEELINRFNNRPIIKLELANRTIDEMEERYDMLCKDYDELQLQCNHLESDLIEAYERMERLERNMHSVDQYRTKVVVENLKLKQQYTSQVELQTGEIGDDFAYYFSVSEQVPSIVSVGVLVNPDYSIQSAGAMIIELLPNHTEQDILPREFLVIDERIQNRRIDSYQGTA